MYQRGRVEPHVTHFVNVMFFVWAGPCMVGLHFHSLLTTNAKSMFKAIPKNAMMWEIALAIANVMGDE